LGAKAEFLVCTLGTRGDVLPFLALSAPLIRRGHKVAILTNRNWRSLVESIGAEFHEIADTDPPQSGRDDLEFYERNVFPSFAISFNFIANKRALNPHCVLLYRANMLGAESAAEKFGLPGIKVVLQPSLIRSIERPPWPLTGLVYGKFATLSKKLIIPALYRLGEATGIYRKYTNRFRASVGLGPLGKAAGGEDLTLVLCPDWFAMPQKDWPTQSRTVGFVYYDVPHDDKALRDFMYQYGSPLVFTPGTGVTDVAEFFSRAASICSKLKMPGVFLSPFLKVEKNWPQTIMVRDYAELHWLLPHAQMLVHHGGIGSIAQAIRAAVPQIILPNRFDQPDNALRTAILVLGGAVLSGPTTVDELCDLIRAVLADREVQQQVKTASKLVQKQSATDRAIDLISQVVTRRFGRAEQA
jgi:rhamnosyltransferase subunit B